MAKMKKTIKKKYIAGEMYSVIMTDKGLLSKDQHKDLLSGGKVDLTDVPDKQMKYLITNNLIKES